MSQSVITTSPSALSLAREIAATHDVGLCPVLADALEEAGYPAEELNELRAERVYGRRPYSESVGRVLADILAVRVERLPDDDGRTHTLRARTVAVDDLAETVAYRAVFAGRAWAVRHGGSVANNYRYRAYTEGAMAAAVYDAATNTVRVKVWAGQLPANKVTACGVAGMFGFGDLADGRVGAARKAAASERLYAEVVSSAMADVA
jgi:hypothetical protein